MKKNKSLNIAFTHPDLGIGGAERLIVDAAVGLKRLLDTRLRYLPLITILNIPSQKPMMELWM